MWRHFQVYRIRFLSFDEQPIAAASIAQVHRAVLKNQKEVAIKVQYPDLEQLMKSDITTMSFVSDFVSWLFPEYRFRWILPGFKEAISAELDFIQEARNSERTANNFENNKIVKIPQVYWDLTTRQVLTMEFCPGHKEIGRTIRAYCSVSICRDLWRDLDDSVRARVREIGLGPFIDAVLAMVRSSRSAVRVLGEKFQDATNSFNFGDFEATVTPVDYDILTSLPFTDRYPPYDTHAHKDSVMMRALYGAASEEIRSDILQDDWACEWAVGRPDGYMNIDQKTRVFLLFLFSCVACSDPADRVRIYYSPALENLHTVMEYSWGGASYANFLSYLRVYSRTGFHASQITPVMSGFFKVLEGWLFSYFPCLGVRSTLTAPLFPALVKWGCDVRYGDMGEAALRKVVNGLTSDQMMRNPWRGGEYPTHIRTAYFFSHRRIDFEGPKSYIWYLGKRVTYQLGGGMYLPHDPPLYMYELTRIMPADDLERAMIGWDASTFQYGDDRPYTELVGRLAPPFIWPEAGQGPQVQENLDDDLGEDMAAPLRPRLPSNRIRYSTRDGQHFYKEPHLISDAELKRRGWPPAPNFTHHDRQESKTLWKMVFTWKDAYVGLSRELSKLKEQVLCHSRRPDAHTPRPPRHPTPPPPDSSHHDTYIGGEGLPTPTGLSRHTSAHHSSDGGSSAPRYDPNDRGKATRIGSSRAGSFGHHDGPRHSSAGHLPPPPRVVPIIRPHRHSFSLKHHTNQQQSQQQQQDPSGWAADYIFGSAGGYNVGHSGRPDSVEPVHFHHAGSSSYQAPVTRQKAYIYESDEEETGST